MFLCLFAARCSAVLWMLIPGEKNLPYLEGFLPFAGFGRLRPPFLIRTRTTVNPCFAFQPSACALSGLLGLAIRCTAFCRLHSIRRAFLSEESHDSPM